MTTSDLYTDIRFKTYESYKNEKITISGYEIILDTKNFLDEHYYGCYKADTVEYITRNIFISTDGYAEFLKIIFKEVKARQLIRIDTHSNQKKLTFDICFDTSLLSSDDITSLSEIAAASGFDVQILSDKVIADFAYISATFTVFHSYTTRIVYNSLKKVLLN